MSDLLNTLISSFLETFNLETRSQHERHQQLRRQLLNGRTQASEIEDLIRSQRTILWPYFWRRHQPDMSRMEFIGGNLREIDFRNTNFSETVFQEADLSFSILEDAYLLKTKFSDSTLVHVSLKGARGLQCVWDRVKAYGADLSDTTFQSAQFKDIDLSNANLTNAFWPSAEMADVDLSRTSANDLNLGGARVIGLNCCKSAMPNAGFYRAKLEGVGFDECNLSGAHFREGHLRNCSLRYTDLTGVDFDGAQLYAVDFSGSNLTKEQISRAVSFDYVTLPDGTPTFPLESHQDFESWYSFFQT